MSVTTPPARPRAPEYDVTISLVHARTGWIVSARVRNSVWSPLAGGYRQVPSCGFDRVRGSLLSAMLRAIGGAVANAEAVRVGLVPSAPRVSRARVTDAYQLRHQARGLCLRCPRPAVNHQHCEQHRAWKNATQMECRPSRVKVAV